MNKQTEALKLMIEALERVSTVDDDCDILSPELTDVVVEAITAGKEALAQPVQDPTALNQVDDIDVIDLNPSFGRAQRPWVELTDDEIDRVTDSQWDRNHDKPIYAAYRAYSRAIAAVIKEKNK
ncbi:hypothetical protein UFOVP1309_59 [uncultured Caudovirales phage]|uniref:Uncharacterized protein n=1 Tax=uncultured Caudovirales phage TaxID=2100421 RepID=A0A6J5S0M1_9CAUD|nr:hypothetical protein UFOVP1309_59 [uncultured Caudovirales phage]